ncbi:MAG: fused MFS/spermidine synthase [Olsenella sp.]|nr:fused MFS/spermidine synthase [Olsenella sp.]
MAHPLPTFLAWLSSLLGRAAGDERVVREAETMFGACRIFDTHDGDGLPVRVLEVEGTWQSATYLDDGWSELVFPYHRHYNRLFEVAPDAQDILMLGGGGFSYPKYLVTHHREVRVDVVEIDPAITRLASDYFYLDRIEEEHHALRDGRLRIFETDARAFLEGDVDGARPSYDAILNDCFSAGMPLASLATAEGVHAIRKRLSPGGIYLANVVSALEGPRSRPLRDVCAALAGEFANVRVIACGSDEPRLPDNNVVVARDAALGLRGTYPLSRA